MVKPRFFRDHRGQSHPGGDRRHRPASRRGDPQPQRRRLSHAREHRPCQHGDGDLHGDVAGADPQHLAFQHQGQLRLRPYRLRADARHLARERVRRIRQRAHSGLG